MKLVAKGAVGLLLVAALSCALAACRREQSPSKAGPIKFGALFPLSGDLEEKGVDSVNGVRLAVDEINAAGGVSSLGGAKLEPVVADTRGVPEVGSEEARRLIEKEGVVAIVGTYQSSVTKPATRVAEKLEAPFIVSISIADIITERGFGYTFRIQPKAEFYARDQIRFLMDLEALAGHSVRRVALLHENTDFGTSASLAQKIAARRHGLQVVADVGYRAEDADDLEEEVVSVLTADPDAILTVTYLLDSIAIRKALVELKSSVPLLDTAGGTVSPEYIQALGPLAEGVLTVTEYSKFAPGSQDLNERFRARYGVDITGDSAYAYQAVLVLKDALERAASRDRKKLRQALSATDISKGPRLVLPADRLRFDQNGQNELARLFVVQIQNGELVPVWPEPYATAKVRIENQ